MSSNQPLLTMKIVNVCSLTLALQEDQVCFEFMVVN